MMAFYIQYLKHIYQVRMLQNTDPQDVHISPGSPEITRQFKAKKEPPIKTKRPPQIKPKMAYKSKKALRGADT